MNTLMTEQNDRHLAGDTFKQIFREILLIFTQVSL